MRNYVYYKNRMGRHYDTFVMLHVNQVLQIFCEDDSIALKSKKFTKSFIVLFEYVMNITRLSVLLNKLITNFRSVRIFSHDAKRSALPTHYATSNWTSCWLRLRNNRLVINRKCNWFVLDFLVGLNIIIIYRILIPFNRFNSFGRINYSHFIGNTFRRPWVSINLLRFCKCCTVIFIIIEVLYGLLGTHSRRVNIL